MAKRTTLSAALAFVLAACAPALPAQTPGATPPLDTPGPVATPLQSPVPTAPLPTVTPPATPTVAPATPSPAAPSPAQAAASVTIVDLAFNPPAVNVPVGGTVTWTNAGNLPHTVTFEDGPDSGALSEGQTFEHTFASAGTFSYVCTIHPSMTGSVVVGE